MTSELSDYSVISVAYEKIEDAGKGYNLLAARTKLLGSLSQETRGTATALFSRVVLGPRGYPLIEDHVVSVVFDQNARHTRNSLNEALKRGPGYQINLAPDAVVKNFSSPYLRAVVINPDGLIHLMDLRAKASSGQIGFHLQQQSLRKAA